MRLLFICSRNQKRSPTAERVFGSREGIETASAGLNKDADTTVTEELLEWADKIFVMEKAHLNRLNKRFGDALGRKRVIVLDIPDDFEYMDKVLVLMLERRVGVYLR
jgi:predicted protein tyrosine phosphatase